jgi:hypothetical protein
MTGSDQLVTELRFAADTHAYGAVRTAALRAADEIERLAAALVAERALSDTLAAALHNHAMRVGDYRGQTEAALVAWRVARGGNQ